MPRLELNTIGIAFLAVALHIPAWADQSGTATLQPDTFLNLDTGVVSQSGGDVFFDGSKLLPQGGAGLHNLGKVGSRIFKSIRAQQAMSVSYSAIPIPAGALVSGDVFGIHTQSGYYVKAIVSATNDGALTLKYTIFGSAPAAQTAAAPQAILALQNNYSWIPAGAGLPNYGIAPGSIFAIIGTGLGPSTQPVLQSSASPGLQTTLDQTSIAVTVGSTTVSPAIYYTSATQVAAVLPSTTPVGKGTITVTYSGKPSAAAPITVVANAPGLDTLAQTGTGLAAVTDINGNVYGVANSAKPGATVILWGSGIGADTNNDDRLYPQKQDNLAGILGVQVFMGGISATVQYAGRSQYPGLDQYNVVIPASVTPGCFVSVVVQIGSMVSNAVTMPISANGGACSDPMTGLNGTQIQTLASKPSGAVNAFLSVLYGAPPSNIATPGGSFPTGYVDTFATAEAWSAGEFGNGYEYVSHGSCTAVPPGQPPFPNSYLRSLDAGTIQLTSPGQSVNLGSGPGLYPTPNNFTVSPGLTYTLSGSGGVDVGKFSATVAVPSTQFNWTNQTLTSITRSQGATITWTGGYPNGTVQVFGTVGDPAVQFYCYAPSSAGQLTIPSSILLALPAGNGDLSVGTVSAPQPIIATGLDIGFVAVAESLAIYSFFPYK
jgi:uncharacterized protein (TIGR03437 family)